MKNELLKIFSKNLKIYLKQSGLNQKELAEKVGVYPSCVSKWLLMKTEPTLSNIAKITTILNCTFEELIDPSVGK